MRPPIQNPDGCHTQRVDFRQAAQIARRHSKVDQELIVPEAGACASADRPPDAGSPMIEIGRDGDETGLGELSRHRLDESVHCGGMHTDDDPRKGALPLGARDETGHLSFANLNGLPVLLHLQSPDGW